MRNGGAIPGGKQLQDMYLQDVYAIEHQKFKDMIQGKKVALIFDEMSDDEGRFALNILVSPIELDSNGCLPSYLADTIFLTRTNNSTVSQAQTVANLGISFDDVVVINTDAAAYMCKAFRDVFKALFPNCVHITCLAHFMNLIGGAFRKPFVQVNEFVRSFNAQ